MSMPEHEPQQIAIMRRLVELSAERTYLNSERTLSVWVRTALELMVLGLAVDRFRLIMAELPGDVGRTSAASNALSNWVGIALLVILLVAAH
jgi:putative membrane protein